MATIDVIAAIVLTAVAFLAPGSLILASRTSAAVQRRTGLILLLWFAAVGTLAALGVFSPHGVGTPAVGALVATTIIAGVIAFNASATVRALVTGAPLSHLVAVNLGRMLGAFFLVLYATGRLPETFAESAGGGDILVAATALPVAWAVHRRIAGWRPIVLTWNALALLDLIVAVAIGVGSAADSPFRFIFESPDTSTMASLPWFLIPGFLVPFYVLTHLAIFYRLAREQK